MARGDATASPVVPALRGIFFGAERYRRALAKALGIGTGELAVLAFLEEAGQLTPREVGERLGITTGSTTAVLDRVEKAGYIKRVPNPGDRRSLYLTLTDSGERAVAWMLDAHAEQLGPLINGSTGLEEFAALLDQVRALISEPLHAAPFRATSAQPKRPEM